MRIVTSVLDASKGRHTTDVSDSRRLWRWWPLVGAAFGGVFVSAAVSLLFLVAAIVDRGDDSGIILVVYAAIIGTIFGVVGGFVAGCVGAVVMWVLERASVRSSRRLDTIVAAVVSGVLALAVGAEQIADAGCNGFGDLLLWIVFPTTVAAVGAAFAVRWIWRRGERSQQTAPDE